MNTLKKVIEIVKQETGAEVNADTALESLGLDSLEFVELMLAIAKDCADIPDAHWGELNTVGDMAQACELQIN